MNGLHSRIRLLASVGMLSLALLVGPAAAVTTFIELSLPEILERAEIGFLGTVSSMRVESREGQPWTVVEFEVERTLLSEESEPRNRTLAFLGGETASGESLQVNLMPVFEVGERVVVLAYDEEYFSPVVGFNQGLWRLDGGELVDETGRRLGLDDRDRLVHDGVNNALGAVLDVLAAGLEEER